MSGFDDIDNNDMKWKIGRESGIPQTAFSPVER